MNMLNKGVKEKLTVGELIAFLEQIEDKDTQIFVREENSDKFTGSLLIVEAHSGKGVYIYE